jgi:autotransporter-associated beta strand protein
MTESDALPADSATNFVEFARKILYTFNKLYSFTAIPISSMNRFNSCSAVKKNLVTAILVGFAPFSLQAASNLWSSGTNGNWNVAANWQGGINVPGSTSVTNNTDSAIFLVNPGVVVSVDSNRNLQSLVFGGNAGSFTLSGGSLILTGGNAGSSSYLASNLAGSNLTQTISTPISVTGNYTFANYNALSSNVMVLGDISSTVSGRTLTLTGGNSGDNIISGVIANGTGSLSVVKSGVGKWILAGNNTYNVGTTILEGVLQVSGANGALAHSATKLMVSPSGSFVIDNTAAAGGNNNARISDTQAVELNGGLIYRGTDTPATNSSETIGTVTFRNNSPTVTVSHGGTNSATLTAAGLAWGGGTPTVFVNGNNLGKDSASTSEVSRFFSTAAPATVGTSNALATGIDAAVQNTKIVATMVGESALGSGGNGTETGVANTFVTYNATTGFRPLNPTDEFTHNAIVGGHNTYLTSNTSVAASAAVNSIVLNGGNLELNPGQTLTNTSGALLFVGSESVIGSGTLAAGSAVHRLYANSGQTGTIAAHLAGTGGVNKSGPGAVILSGSNSGLSGGVAVNSGSLLVGHNNALGTGVVTLYGAEAVLGAHGAARTIANDVAFTTDTNSSLVTGGVIGGDQDLTFNGKVYHANATNGGLEISNTGLTTFAGGLFTAASGNGRNITLSGSGDLTVNGVFIAAASPGTGGGLSYAGSGNLTITGASTYQGVTGVFGGTVDLDFSALATPTNMIVSTSALTLGGGTLQVTGKAGAFNTAQTFDAASGNDLVLSAATRSAIRLDANGGNSTTLTIGNTWGRGANSVLNVELGAGTTLTSAPITSVTSQAATSVIMGYATVKDATGTGFGIVQNGNIVRYTAADALASNSNDTARNFSTSGTLALNAGAHGARSLSIDTAGGDGELDLTSGASLTFLGGSPGAILMDGSNDYLISSGTIGANGSELILHQMGTGVLTISSQLFGSSGSLVKNGDGKVVLAGSSSFAGATVVTMGTLVVDGALSNSAITVNSGGTLGGGGLVSDVTMAAGSTLDAGGGSAGRNLSAASLVLNRDSLLHFDIDGSGAGEFDSISFSAPLALTGSLVLDFGSVLSNGTSIDLFSGVIAEGAFQGIVGVGAYAGTFVDGVLDTGSQVLSFDQSTGVLSVVPEPSTAGFLFLGAGLGLWLFRRRV